MRAGIRLYGQIILQKLTGGIKRQTRPSKDEGQTCIVSHWTPFKLWVYWCFIWRLQFPQKGCLVHKQGQNVDHIISHFHWNLICKRNYQTLEQPFVMHLHPCRTPAEESNYLECWLWANRSQRSLVFNYLFGYSYLPSLYK